MKKLLLTPIRIKRPEAERPTPYFSKNTTGLARKALFDAIARYICEYLSACASLPIAHLTAKSITEIPWVSHLDRVYEDLAGKL